MTAAARHLRRWLGPHRSSVVVPIAASLAVHTGLLITLLTLDRARPAREGRLTEDLIDEPGQPTRDALEQVLDFFDERLAG